MQPASSFALAGKAVPTPAHPHLCGESRGWGCFQTQLSTPQGLTPCILGDSSDLGPPHSSFTMGLGGMKKICSIKPDGKRVQWVAWGIRTTTGGRAHPKLYSYSLYFFLPLFFLLSIRCSPCFLMSSRVRTLPWSLSAKSKGSGGESGEEWAGEGLQGHLCCGHVPGESRHGLEG